MGKKRQLGDAMVDEIIVDSEETAATRRPLTGRRLYSGATVMAAAIVGLIGGYLLRRWIRWI